MSLARQIIEANRPVLEAVERIQRFSRMGMVRTVAAELADLGDLPKLAADFNRLADADLARIEESIRTAPGSTPWAGGFVPKQHPSAVVHIPHANDDPASHGPIIA
jgi:hypothetical protein